MGKGIGGLHDTFRIVNKKKTHLYTEPQPEVSNIIDIQVPETKMVKMGKRKFEEAGLKQSYKRNKIIKRTVGKVYSRYKKSTEKKKPSLGVLSRRSNKVGKQTPLSGNKKSKSKFKKIKIKKIKKRVKDRF